MDVIEPFSPYPDCLMWRIHRAYYQQRGVAVWTEREIPSIATTNLAHARHHVRIYMRLALPAQGPLVVLEVGGGSGEFAASFLTALRELAPALLARTRYVLTDFSADTLAAAAALPRVAAWIASGHLVTRTYDLARPTELDAPVPIAMAIANYVCCALPMRPVEKDGATWTEPWVETRAELDGRTPEALRAALLEDATAADAQTRIQPVYEWRPIDLEAVLGEALATVVTRATEDHERARVLVPALYIGFMRALAPHLLPGGVFVTSDYGFVGRERLAEAGPRDELTERFANSLGQEVQFALFDVLAEVLGWDVARTNDPLDEVHVAVLAPGGLAAAAREEVDRRTWGRTETGHLLDFREAARVLEAQGDKARALRFWLRCSAIDPRWEEPYERIAELALDQERLDVAERHLEAGLALAPDAAAWEHGLGRVALLRGDLAGARGHWMQGFMREPRPAIAVALARLALDGDDLGGAFRWLERALELAPDDAQAQAALREVRDRTWRAAMDAFRNEGAYALLPVAPDADADGDA